MSWLILLGGYGLIVAALPHRSRSYVVRRAGRIVLLVLIATLLVFVVIELSPGPGRVGLGEANADLLGRYLDWLGGVFRGDMGFSRHYQEPVNEGLARTVPVSLLLVLYAQVIALTIAVPAALWSALNRGKPADRVISTSSLFLMAVPQMVAGPVLRALFSVGGIKVGGLTVGVEWFPAILYVPMGEGVGEHLMSMTLPSVTLAIGLIAPYVLVLRGDLLSVLEEEYMTVAKSRGFGPWRLMRNHALRPAAPGLVGLVGVYFGMLLGNLLIVELIFNLPGLGDYLRLAVVRRDSLAVLGGITVLMGLIAATNLIADTLVPLLDPRVGYHRQW